MLILESTEKQFASAWIPSLAADPLKWIIGRQPNVNLPFGELAFSTILKQSTTKIKVSAVRRVVRDFSDVVLFLQRGVELRDFPPGHEPHTSLFMTLLLSKHAYGSKPFHGGNKR
jgi:hypothetical protein